MLKVGDLGKTTHGLNVLKRVQDRFIDTSIGAGAKRNDERYSALAFDNSEPTLPIKSILIGPHPNQDNQQTAVELLLNQHGIKAEVRRSKLSLRQ